MNAFASLDVRSRGAANGDRIGYKHEDDEGKKKFFVRLGLRYLMLGNGEWMDTYPLVIFVFEGLFVCVLGYIFYEGNGMVLDIGIKGGGGVQV